MIELNLVGGLGNQMFEYAYARAISLENENEPIRINATYAWVGALWSWLRYRTPIGTFKHISNSSLAYLNIPDFVIFDSPIHGIISSVLVGLIHYILQLKAEKIAKNDKTKLTSLYKTSTSKGRYFAVATDEWCYVYFPHSKTHKKLKRLSGTFQSEKYFYSYRKSIMQELMVRSEPSPENQDIINELQNCNSVCVHVRAGDYREVKKISEYAYVCTAKYFNNAMKYMSDNIECPVFYIFSDRILWVKENVEFAYPVKYMERINTASEELRLMYNCKHFIISNSSFSWWASYLSNNNSGRITCVPAIWDNRKNSDELDIHRDDMTKVDVE